MARNESKAEKALFVKQGEKIRELRTRASITMVDLAKEVDRAPLTISLIEKGEYGMSVLLLERILSTLSTLLPPHIKFDIFKDFGLAACSRMNETKEIEELRAKNAELEKTIVKIAGSK
ncbi:MAG: helix-turn-helix transcriptional regulator [Candidatus Njordarchaeales archaeon]